MLINYRIYQNFDQIKTLFKITFQKIEDLNLFEIDIYKNLRRLYCHCQEKFLLPTIFSNLSKVSLNGSHILHNIRIPNKLIVRRVCEKIQGFKMDHFFIFVNRSTHCRNIINRTKNPVSEKTVPKILPCIAKVFP